MTEKQLQLLNFIRDTFTHSDKAPTFKSMRLFMSVASNQAVEDALAILEREKYISREGPVRRTIALTNKSMTKGYPALKINKENDAGLRRYIGEDLSSYPITGTAVPQDKSIVQAPLGAINMQNISLSLFAEERSEGTS
jgi:SOS-response transcriptional repressor LexA